MHIPVLLHLLCNVQIWFTLLMYMWSTLVMGCVTDCWQRYYMRPLEIHPELQNDRLTGGRGFIWDHWQSIQNCRVTDWLVAEALYETIGNPSRTAEWQTDLWQRHYMTPLENSSRTAEWQTDWWQRHYTRPLEIHPELQSDRLTGGRGIIWHHWKIHPELQSDRLTGGRGIIRDHWKSIQNCRVTDWLVAVVSYETTGNSSRTAESYPVIFHSLSPILLLSILLFNSIHQTLASTYH